MTEPTKPQHEAFCELAESCASVYVEHCPPGPLWLARCLDESGHPERTVFVHRDGSLGHELARAEA